MKLLYSDFLFYNFIIKKIDLMLTFADKCVFFQTFLTYEPDEILRLSGVIPKHLVKLCFQCS